MAGGFAAGFFGQMTEDITNKQEYVRNRVEERRQELRQRGLERMAQVNEQRQAYETAANGLMRMSGVNRDRVLSALESDPDAIIDAYNRARQNPNITGTILNQFFSVYDSTPSSQSLGEAINNILPLAADISVERQDPSAAERVTLASLLGMDLDAALDEEVYNDQLVGGMTGNQIAASMSQPIRARGTGTGAQLDYSLFSPDNLRSDEPISYNEAAQFESDVASLYQSRREGEIASLERRLTSLAGNPELSPEEKTRQQVEIETRISELEGLTTLDDFMEIYGTDLLDRQLRFYPEERRQRMRDLYLTSVTEDSEDEPTPEETFGVDEEDTIVTTELPTPEEDTDTPTPESTPEPEAEPTQDRIEVGTTFVEDLGKAIPRLLENPGLGEIEVGGQTFTRDQLLGEAFEVQGVDPVKELQELSQIFEVYKANRLPLNLRLPNGQRIRIESDYDFNLFRQAVQNVIDAPDRPVGGDITPTETPDEVRQGVDQPTPEKVEEYITYFADNLTADTTPDGQYTREQVERMVFQMGVDPEVREMQGPPTAPRERDPRDNVMEDAIRRAFNTGAERVQEEVQRSSERVAPTPPARETPDRTVPEFAFVVGEDDPQELIDQVEEAFAAGMTQVDLMLEINGRPQYVRVGREEFRANKDRLLGTRRTN